jgi:ubiquinone/menaquinone biosynthesis C-methylase UbiE
LVYDLLANGILGSYGLDVSEYAIEHSKIRHRVRQGNALKLPFSDKSFDLVVSINVIHNLPRDGVIRALKEIERVSDKAYIVVDSYNTPEEKAIFESWVLTAETHGYPSDWLKIFDEAGYKGYYSWNLL